MSTEQLRVGDAERDEVTTALHEHFAQGRLTREELDERLTTTLSARTVGDLRAVTRDLPGALVASPEHPWGTGAAYWGGGPFVASWARGDRGPRGRGRTRAAGPWGPGGPARGGWGPPRGLPFGPLLLVALIVAAVTGGWWVLFPLLACLWLAVVLRGARHWARR